MSEETQDTGITLEYLLAGAIMAAGGELKYEVEHLLDPDILGKQIYLTVEDGVVSITLTDTEEA